MTIDPFSMGLMALGSVAGGPKVSSAHTSSPQATSLDSSGWTVATQSANAKADSQRWQGEPANGVGANIAGATAPAGEFAESLGQYIPWMVAGLVAVAAVRLFRKG